MLLIVSTQLEEDNVYSVFFKGLPEESLKETKKVKKKQKKKQHNSLTDVHKTASEQTETMSC